MLVEDGDEKETTEAAETTEETSEEESTEESEDSTEESTDESSDSEEKAPKAELFFDPKKLPEELKPTFKKMQASFTKRMQIASLSVKKAEAFDNLTKMPEFQTWLEQQQTGTTTTSRKDSKGEEAEGEKSDSVRAIIREELTKIVGPVKAKVEDREVREEFEQFQQDYPFYLNFEPQLKEVLTKRPNLTYEEALSVVAFPELLKTFGKQINELHTTKKKANSTTKPNRSTVTESAPGKAKTITEAFALAKAQLAGSGKK